MKHSENLLHTTFFGSPDKPLVVMLHGIMGSTGTWGAVIDEIKDDYYVMAVDLLGFGDSPKPRIGYNLKDHLESLSATFQKHNATEPMMIVGFSLGAVLSIYAVKKGIVKPKRLLLISPPIYPTRGEMGRRIKRSPTPAVFRRGPIAQAAQSFSMRTPRFLRLAARVTHPELPAAVVTDSAKVPYYAYIKTRRKVLEKETVIRSLPYVKRSMIIAGTLDHYTDISYLSQLVRYKGDMIVLDKVGHSIPFAAPAEVVKAIKSLSSAPSVNRLQTLRPNAVRNEL